MATFDIIENRYWDGAAFTPDGDGYVWTLDDGTDSVNLAIPIQTIPSYAFGLHQFIGDSFLSGDSDVLLVSDPPITFSVTLVGQKIRVTFDRSVLDSVQLRDLSRYTLTGPTTLVLTGIVVASNYVELSFFGPMQAGGSYSVALLVNTARALNDTGANAAGAGNFIGVYLGPTIVMARSIDARTMEVIFSEVVNMYDALTVGNYAIDHGLTVTAVHQVTAVIYRLTTSRQTVGTAYTVTVSNIRDANGNVT